MSTSLVDIILVGFGALIPLLALAKSVRFACWSYIALIPLYMYHKSMFDIIKIGSFDLQWPTLTKDIVGLLLLTLLVFSSVLRHHRMKVISVKSIRSKIIILLVFLIYCVTIGIIFGGGLGKTLVGTRPYVLYQLLGLMMGGGLLVTRRSWTMFADIIIVGCFCIALIALIQRYIDKDFLIISSLHQMWAGQVVKWDYDAVRLKGFFMTANPLAYFMVMGMACGCWRLVYCGISYMKLVIPFMLAIMFWALILTSSRSALIALFISLTVLILFHRTYAKMVYFWLVFAAIGFFALLYLSPYSSRFNNVEDNPRLAIWAAYSKQTASSPRTFLFGNGVGSMGRYGAEVVSSGVQLNSVADKIGGSGNLSFADNIIVRTFYETGIFGFFFIIWALFQCRALIRIRRRAKYVSEVAYLSLAISVMSFVIVISMFSVSLNTYPWSFIYWILLSGSIATLRFATKNLKSDQVSLQELHPAL